MSIFLIFQLPTNLLTTLLIIKLFAFIFLFIFLTQSQFVFSFPLASPLWFKFSIRSDPFKSLILIPSSFKLLLISVFTQLIFMHSPNLIIFFFIHFNSLVTIPFIQALSYDVLISFLIPCYILLSFLLSRSFFSEILLLFV